MGILSNKLVRIIRTGAIFVGAGFLLTAATVTQAQELQLPREAEGTLPGMTMDQYEPKPISILSGEPTGRGGSAAAVPVFLNKSKTKSTRSLKAARSFAVKVPLSDICKDQTNRLSAVDKQRMGVLIGDRCPFLQKTE